MALVVTKFGGTSVGSTERIMAVAARLIERRRRATASSRSCPRWAMSPTSSSLLPRGSPSAP